ncbi:MAG: apolipoprotein N-acyltransferase [Rickettsiales bacterium]|jgi:apolipoprotein N-acyltransferase|nr:apolipoprotein N-acyltransferase [Rickettsiales bacterium]
MKKLIAFFFNRATLLAWPCYFAAQMWLLSAFGQSEAKTPLFPWFALAYAALVCALYVGMAYSISRLAPEADRWLAFPAAFALMEWLRGDVFIGYPFVLLAGVWANSPIVFQSVSLVGMYGLSFLTMLAITALIGKRVKAAAATVAITLAFGAWRLSTPDTMTDYTVRLVNAGIASGGEASVEDNFARLADYTKSAGLDRVDLVVWPENSLWVDLRHARDWDEKIAHLITLRSRLVSGYVGKEYVAGGFRRSAALAIFDRAGLETTYTKLRLVPFGEYVPFWLPIRSFLEKKKISWGRGDRRELLALGRMFAMPYICYEAVFPGLRTPATADFILALANDSWFDEAGRARHFEMTRFQAVAEGATLVRAANRGVSAVVSPYGRITARLDSEGVLDARLPARASRTLFSYTGNWLFVAAMLLILSMTLKKKGFR